jgi:hypothetical protein
VPSFAESLICEQCNSAERLRHRRAGLRGIAEGRADGHGMFWPDGGRTMSRPTFTLADAEARG